MLIVDGDMEATMPTDPHSAPPRAASSSTNGSTAFTRRVHLTADGVSVLLDVTGGRIPVILH